MALNVKKSSVRLLTPPQQVCDSMSAFRKGNAPGEHGDSLVANNWSALLDMMEDGNTKKSDIPAPEDWYSDTDPFIALRYYALDKAKDAQIKFFLAINFIKTMKDLHEYRLECQQRNEQQRNEPLPLTETTKKSDVPLTETTKKSDVPDLDNAQRAKTWSAIVNLFRDGSTNKSELPAPETWRLDTDPCIPIRYYARDDVKNAEIEFYLEVNGIKTMQDLRNLTRWFF